MILSTTEHIQGKRVVKTLGLVRGNTARARHIGQDIAAFLRMLVGGEVVNYTKLLAEAREQAIDRMIAQAESLGANAIIMVRFQTAPIVANSAELLAYGTAVVIDNE